ncbi:rhomboid family intramembrane serine protease [cyanobiont of Ornithocercus magnificus]|nr:rhomboid family intramembrane serine protease [cyanobiont of Ornithocercus magnificus]
MYKTIVNTLVTRSILPIIIIGIAWVQEVLDNVFFGGKWIFTAGRGEPLYLIVFSWFSHGSIWHLFGNTVVFLPLSWLVLTKGIRNYFSIWLCVFFGKLINQIFWPEPAHGISDIVYGLLGYLIIIGILEKRVLSISLTFLTIIVYGYMVADLLPWNVAPGVSWLGHFSGFIGGIVSAFGTYREPEIRNK